MVYVSLRWWVVGISAIPLLLAARQGQSCEEPTGPPKAATTHSDVPRLRLVVQRRDVGSLSLPATPIPRATRALKASGMGLYPPRGANPPKSGVIVPDDFELPPGYLRHYQTDDDGRPLPPILVFHPDYEVVDENGRSIDVPQDRVVPPEYAPPGMPIRILEVPTVAGHGGSIGSGTPTPEQP